MKSVSVLSVVYNAERDHFEVVKHIENEDGTTDLNLHVIPQGAVEMRMAEFDVNDLDTVIDMLLYEPFTDSGNLIDSATDEGKKRHLANVAEQKAKHVKKPPQASKAQLNQAGVDLKYVDAVDLDPYQVFRDNVVVHDEVIAVYKEHVAMVRGNHVKEKAEQEKRVKEKLTGAERAAAARKQLFRQENMRRER